MADSTLDESEVKKFKEMSAQWWDPRGPAAGLHAMNACRVPLIVDGLAATGKSKKNSDMPLEGLKLMDIGCGGGILSEPLARLGATVIGLDPCKENLETAKQHADQDEAIKSRISYLPMTVEDYLANHHNPSEPFDAVVASEVIEHVNNPETFVSTCANLIDKDGSFFVTTINRTTRSWLGAIIVAENVLRLLPSGTHDWNKFITPEELKKMMETSDCHVRLVHGMMYMPVVNKFSWFFDTSINYALHAVKQ